MTARATDMTAGCPVEPDVLERACVVIVDDLQVNAEILERMLTSVGVGRVHTVTDAREAVARCHEVGADLVLLDLHMPRVDGHAVLAELRARASRRDLLPVLVLTADTTAETRDRALQAGANDFLTKPLDYTEVVLRVRNLLETRRAHVELQRRNDELQADLDARAEADREQAEQHEAGVARIRRALAPGALEMVLQPIFDLAGGHVVGFEALARFTCEPRRGPDQWFAEAARIGRGVELELLAAQCALDLLDEIPGDCFLSINVSPETATSAGLATLLARYDGRRIVLELTEHARVDDYAHLVATLEPLRAAGVRWAVDDTGAGYAGLQHLLRLRPHLVKLDIALTRDVDSDPARRALATALVAFCQQLGSTIVAEGIETAGELAALRELGVSWGQGYHLARPAPLAALADRFTPLGSPR